MKRIIPLFLFLLILFPDLCISRADTSALSLRGLWVATVYNLDYPSRAGLSAAQLKAEADEIIQNAAQWGYNTIFLQVRPNGDALYPSDIFPWSAVLSGTQGTAPEDGFDPLEYFIQQAHEMGLTLHAWINPYRLTTAAFASLEEAVASLSPHHPAHDMMECLVLHSDGRLYLDPGMPASRQLIVSGIAELLENYDLDGIHLDDYFYPGAVFDDAASFAVYGGDGMTVEDFRRTSVNQLIQVIYGLVKTEKPDALFGISPSGIWANKSSHALGSDTAGNSSYYDLYADSRTWVKEELIDYIMPQLYWHIGSSEGDFSTLLDWWSDVVAGTQVELYLGLAAYRIADASPDSVWYGTAELERQLALAHSSGAAGFCMFRYDFVASTELKSLLIGETPVSPLPTNLPPLSEPLNNIKDFSLTNNLAVLAHRPVNFVCSAPMGSNVTIEIGERRIHLEAVKDTFQGKLDTSALELERPLFPLVLCRANGFLFARIVPHSITVVADEGTASITRIFETQTEAGWHTITLETGAPIAAALTQKATAIQLTLAPCSLAVLFESDFLEAVSLRAMEDEIVYTFILPRNSRKYDYDLQWYPDKIVLGIRQK